MFDNKSKKDGERESTFGTFSNNDDKSGNSVRNHGLFDDLKSMHKHYEIQENQEVKEEKLTYPPEVRKKTLTAVLVALLIGNMQVSNLSIVLPNYVDHNPDWEFDEEVQQITTPSSNNIAVILAAFSLAQVMFAPFNSLIKNQIGTKNTILVGLFIVTLSTIGLGAIANIQDGNYFVYYAIALRYLQGVGGVLLQITSYGVICTMFTDNLMKYIGYLEIVVGVGCALGPAFGQLLIALVSYELTMYIFATLCFFGLFLCQCYIPKELNQIASTEEIAELELLEEEGNQFEINQKNQQKIGWCTVFSNRYAMMALLCIFTGGYNGNFWASFIETYFQRMGNEHVAGIAILAMGGFYLGTCFVLPLLCSNVPRRLIFVIVFIGFGFVCMFLGPSQMLGLYDQEWSQRCSPDDKCLPKSLLSNKDHEGYQFTTRIIVVATALALIGFFQVFVFIPIIPEMLERIQDELKISEGENEIIDNAINDKVNDSYGFFFALSQLVSPLIGSAIYSSGKETMDAKGSEAAMPKITDFSMIFNFSFALFLLIFNCGPYVVKENREFQKRIEELRLKNVPENEKDEARKISKSLHSNNFIGTIFRDQTIYSQTNSAMLLPRGTFTGGQNSLMEQKQDFISAYKAKVTMKDNRSVNYGAVLSAVTGFDKSDRKRLMQQVQRSQTGGSIVQGQQHHQDIARSEQYQGQQQQLTNLDNQKIGHTSQKVVLKTDHMAQNISEFDINSEK